MTKPISDLARHYLDRMRLLDAVESGMLSTDPVTKGEALAVLARAERAAKSVEDALDAQNMPHREARASSRYKDAREAATERGERFPSWWDWLNSGGGVGEAREQLKLSTQYRLERLAATGRGEKVTSYALWVKSKKVAMMDAFCDEIIEKRNRT